MRDLWTFLVFFVPVILASPLSAIDAGRWGGSSVIARLLNDSSSGENVQCYSSRQGHDIRLKPIVYSDCVKAAEKATIGGKAAAPMHFSKDPNVGMAMPESWAYGSCVVRIDMRGKEDEDTFPMFVVANAASLIAEKCSTPDTSGLGGLGLIGPKKVVMIFVYGRIPRPPPKPRPTILAAVDIA
ncbi:MAG: hypothetical protein L6R39_006928 [Caloplaca ligustica]|nr:MAG: hypothetical protein L6R39_006928 [Caloplaca ligustica]